MLMHATDAQNRTFETIRQIFGPRRIKFTLIGGAACREYGLSRPVKDLDFVVDNYLLAKRTLQGSGEFNLDDNDPDVTDRTCTLIHAATEVAVDVLTGGIRINDHCYVNGGIVHDAIPIPNPTGFGDILTLDRLIAMKVSVVLSSETSKILGRIIRPEQKVAEDVRDVETLISVHGLHRDLALGDISVERRYSEIYDNLAAEGAGVFD
jgi:hypothetical protein